ncbi:MAG: hypothetical protein PHW07_02580 [Sulfurospirillaceae bacterium]|nr:hypothetical protein [Sulfurospirillaceae bacterium]
MQSTQTIFSTTIKENLNTPQVSTLIQEMVFELSKKKLHRLKDESKIQTRAGELFEIYCKTLSDNQIKTSENISLVINGLIQAVSYEKEEFLYKSIYEKEQLEKSIFSQKQQIKNTISNTYNTLESHIATDQDETSDLALKALNDVKLRGIEMLGIIKETTQEAILTTLEKGSDIKDTIYEIAKNLLFQTVCEGEFKKQRIMDIAKTVMQAGVDIANEDQRYSKEILEGAADGLKDGIAKAIEKFKNDLKYAPEEVDIFVEKDLNQTKKELSKIEEDLIDMLEELSLSGEGVSKNILTTIIKEMNSSAAKIRRAVNEAKEAIAERMEILKEEAVHFEIGLKEKAEKRIESFKKDMSEFEKIAGQKIEVIKSFEFESEKAKKAATEAKKMGYRAWEVAKNMVDNAVKSAKEAIKKDDKN